MPRLTRIEMLRYALTGAVTERGVCSGYMSDGEEVQIDKDIAEIERRIAKEEAKHAGLNVKESP